MQAQAVDFKIATIAPEGSQWMQDIRAAAADIKTATQGRVVVKLYGGGVMGNEKQVLRKIRIGQLHGGAFTASGLAERYPDIVVYGLPMIFASQDEVDYVRQRMDGTLLKGLEQAGFVAFGFAGGGFARIFANRPVTGTADTRGQKIWVPEGDRVSTAAMEALRLSPVALPVTDVLTGLQTGLIDVVAAPPVGVIALQWHTRVKYMTTTPLMYTMGLMAVDAPAFGKLSAGDQAVFRDAMMAVYRRLDQKSASDDQAAQKALQAGGIKLIEANADDVKGWRDAVAIANRQLGEQGVYAPGLLAQVQSYLQEYRQHNKGAAPVTPARP
jgi:TRAP-type C4-dicarboxylate transport system substrate-binding protein